MYNVEVHEETTVRDVLRGLHRRHLVPVGTARTECYIALQSRFPVSLEASQTLSAVGVTNNSTLLVDYRLRGGSKSMPSSFVDQAKGISSIMSHPKMKKTDLN